MNFNVDTVSIQSDAINKFEYLNVGFDVKNIGSNIIHNVTPVYFGYLSNLTLNEFSYVIGDLAVATTKHANWATVRKVPWSGGFQFDLRSSDIDTNHTYNSGVKGIIFIEIDDWSKPENMSWN